MYLVRRFGARNSEFCLLSVEIIGAFSTFNLQLKSYGVLLDHAEVVPDSKPSAKMNAGSMTAENRLRP
mgnify:CR=1 FL=1